MADAHTELRLVKDGLHSLTRRLDLRGDQLSQLARRLRQASSRPTFQAPAGDRSRVFVESQARRLDMLANRYAALHATLSNLGGSLRAQVVDELRPVATLEVGVDKVDWTGAQGALRNVIARCAPPDRPEWEAVSADDDPELPTRPRPPKLPPRTPPNFVNAHGPAFDKPQLKPVGRTWRLDVGEIRRMTRELRTLGAQIDELGVACRRDLNDPEGRMPAELRNAIERTGLTTQRVCDDVGRRLRRHAVAIDKKVATPGLFGPGPEYGLSAFGIDPNIIPIRMPLQDKMYRPVNDWHDRVRELVAIMEWLCRRLPVIFGTPADHFLGLVGVDGQTPPPERPPARLPPKRYSTDGMAFTKDLITDPATGVRMGRGEYFQRYGVRFGAPLPAPVTPSPVVEPIVSRPTDSSPPNPPPAKTPDVPVSPAPPTSMSTPVADVVAGTVAGGAVAAGTAAVTRRRRVAEVVTDEDEDDEQDPVVRSLSGSPTGPGSGSGSASENDRGPVEAGSAGSSTTDTTGGPVETSGTSGGPIGTAPPGAQRETPPTPDPRVAVDAEVAVRRGGVRVTPGAGAALGSVIVGGATAGVVINNRAAAKKITSWAKYRATKRVGGRSKEDA